MSQEWRDSFNILTESPDTLIMRLVPRRTERLIEFEIPRISEPKDAVAALSRIMEGVGREELTASEAGSLVSASG